MASTGDGPGPAAGVRTHVALVGLSGTGKTTVAPLLARRRGLDVVDLDRAVELRSGRSAATVFAEDGEDGFHDLESDELGLALDGPPAVIATGGGVVVRAANRDRLRREARVVWLRAAPEELAERLDGSPQPRPLLGGDAATALHRLAREREPLYREVADLVVEVGGRTPAAIAEQVDRELPS